jgi:hypothetical protein
MPALDLRAVSRNRYSELLFGAGGAEIAVHVLRRRGHRADHASSASHEFTPVSHLRPAALQLFQLLEEKRIVTLATRG